MRIFLDFDGVLRSASSPRSCLQVECVKELESVVLRHPQLKVVITSTWRQAMNLAKLRQLFSAEFATRIEGVTPDIFDEDDCARHAEILAYLGARGLTSTRWIAIDDDPTLFRPGAPVLVVDPGVGFDAECGRRLDTWVASNPAQL